MLTRLVQEVQSFRLPLYLSKYANVPDWMQLTPMRQRCCGSLDCTGVLEAGTVSLEPILQVWWVWNQCRN